ncbi:MAG: type I-E CRISPR-associated protein Cas7/Cse4/CasC [Nocardioides sp.]|jgi:CRISPR system Cascade subunit CasC
MPFLTVHVLRALPMHNLNRDQNGLPKSQFDGGIQRGRLSSQSIKRPARIAFREAVQALPDAPSSIRTMDSHAAKKAVEIAEAFAMQAGVAFDVAVATKTADSVVKSLAKAGKKEESDSSDTATDKKDNILLFSEAEIETLAQALVDAQNGAEEPTVDDFILDFRSPSLDVAAFGRMFAAKASKSTQAAVAVSHAVMTHEMPLTIDYFTAVDEFEDKRDSAGAGHLGLAYYTSGVYYSTFTIDPAQFVRSWSGINSTTARAQLEALIKSLIEALPTGKLTNTNAHTKPVLVLAENQRSRTVYEFETPVLAGPDGGYTAPSIQALAAQARQARTYDADNYLDTVLFNRSEVAATLEGVEAAASIDELASRVAELVMQSLGGDGS